MEIWLEMDSNRIRLIYIYIDIKSSLIIKDV